MRLALIQMLASSVDQFEETAERIARLVNQAAEECRPDLVLLPECAYPAYLLGLDEEALEQALSHTERILRMFSDLAREHEIYLAAGIVLPELDGLLNSVVLFDRRGKQIARADKSNLWHFDDNWFKPGLPARVVDTEFGKIGMMVCADGRIPELAGLLREQGARLILDPVNLSASATCSELLSNAQYEYILPARARENGLFIAACGKAGVEAGCVTNLGRSIVLSPQGEILAEASPDREEILCCDIDLEQACLPDRRTADFTELNRPTEELTIFHELQNSYRMDELNFYTVIARFPYQTEAEYLEKAEAVVQKAELMKASLIVLPELDTALRLTGAITERLSDLLGEDTRVVIAGLAEGSGELMRIARVIDNQGTQADFVAVQAGEFSSPNEVDLQAVAVWPGCRVAVVFDQAVESPELARTAMLRGADVLVCFDRANDAFKLKTLKTRAVENRIFLIRSSANPEADNSLIINPDGAVISTTFIQDEHMSGGLIFTGLSKQKWIVPGTDVILGRHPGCYKV